MDEQRDRFIRQVKTMVKYWSLQPNITPEKVADGVAYSIMTLIDGSGSSTGYSLCPLDANGNELDDIGQNLHEYYSASK